MTLAAASRRDEESRWGNSGSSERLSQGRRTRGAGRLFLSCAVGVTRTAEHLLCLRIKGKESAGRVATFTRKEHDMLDATDHSTSALASVWKDALLPGDVVSFRFPVVDPDTADAAKRRPCLVLDVEVIGGERHAVLAYGTTSKGGANRGYEIRVRSDKALIAAGLHKATRFVGARRIRVPLSHEDFVVSSATEAPVLGRLDAACRERMHAVHARIHAERDMAVEDRRSRRDEGRRWKPRLYRMDQRAVRRTSRLEVRS